MKTIKNNPIWAALIAVSAIIFSCKKSDPPAQASKPTITTNAVINITATSATGGGFIGDSSTTYIIIGRGIRYSSMGDPSGSATAAETNDIYNTPANWGSYPSNITGLTPNTTYYVRAWVGYKIPSTSTQGFIYGDLRTFKTAP